jgi:hypothetical protein
VLTGTVLQSYNGVTQTFRTPKGAGAGFNIEIGSFYQIHNAATQRVGPWEAVVRDDDGYGDSRINIPDQKTGAMVQLDGVPVGYSDPGTDARPGAALIRRVATTFRWIGDPAKPSTWK